MTQLTVDQVIGGYLSLRAKKSVIQKAAEEKVAALEAQMDKLEAWIKEQADKQGVTSFRTPNGTAFLTTIDYASVADWDSVISFIKDNDAYDMLEKRIAKNAVRGYIEANKAVPPGVNYGTRLEVNFRKPSNKIED